MGSSKKKDKDKSREHKKKRRRSHSRSRSPHERKHKRKDRDRSRERDRDYDRRRRDDYDGMEEGAHSSKPVQIPGLGEPYEFAEQSHGYEDGEIPGLGQDVKEEKVPPEMLLAESSDSLSIVETNKLRAKIGLKPLEMDSGATGGGTTKKEDVHVPAVNLAQVKKQEDLKNKLMAAKEKRRINALLGKVKTLGENSDDDDDVAGWVKKMRKAEKEKKLAEKRAKMMDEMDSAFGIGDLVEEEFGVKEKQRYSSKHLAGLKVQHAGSSFKEGKTVILTLQDKGVLDEDEEEVLVNVNMVDDERHAKNVENKKKKPDYKAYADDEYDEFGMPKKKELLDKYNEEIDGEKKEGFVLKSGGRYTGTKERLQEEMKEEIQKHRIELTLPAPSLASEFYTEEEMQSFKKVKKKVRKIRKKPKMLKADDLLPLPDEPMEVPGEGIPGLDYVGGKVKQEEDDPDVEGPDEDLTGVVIDDEAANELQSALEKTRKLKQNKSKASADRRVADDINEKTKNEMVADDSDDETEQGVKTNIILNQTSEFCRTLGDIPTYGQAGNRLEDTDELMDIEEEKPMDDADDANNPGWQEVAIDEDRAADIQKEEKSVLDEEPVVGLGVAAALNLATKKGYLSEEKGKQPTAKTITGIESQNYSIEDKRHDDLDDKYRKRERFVGGMVSEFKEKEGYKPNVKLDYVDDTGRLMSQKEAFRYLSHSFHGKGSGKMKTEKRKKKIEEEQLMKSMSSSDTPLGTAAMLEDKLQQQKVPYLVLSGGNQTLTSNRISK